MDGYRILTNGLLIQIFSDTSIAGGIFKLYNLPIGYSTQYNVVGTSNLNNGGLNTVMIYDKTLNGFKWGQGQGGSGWYTGTANFIAIGL